MLESLKGYLVVIYKAVIMKRFKNLTSWTSTKPVYSHKMLSALIINDSIPKL